MKKYIFPIMALSCFIASAAHATVMYDKEGWNVDFYGKIDGRNYVSHAPSQNTDQSQVRLGLRSRYQLNDNVAVFGQVEEQFKGWVRENAHLLRVMYAGLDFGHYGRVDYGRNYGVMYDVNGWTDQLPLFGTQTFAYADDFLVLRAYNVLTYRNNNLFGLDPHVHFAFQYQGKNRYGSGPHAFGNARLGDALNDDGGGNYRLDNDEGVGVSASYDFDSGVSMIGAYFRSKRTAQQQQNILTQGKYAQGWAAGIRYRNGHLYTALIYAQTRNATPSGTVKLNGLSFPAMAHLSNNIEAVLNYSFDNGLKLSLSYAQSKAKDQDYQDPATHGAVVGSHYITRYVTPGITYNFNANMFVYLAYKYSLLSKDDDFYKARSLIPDDMWGLGVTYHF